MVLPAIALDWFEITCGECGISFCVPRHWRDSRVEDKKDFYCPNGHCRAYIESNKDRQLREQLEKIESLQRQVKWREDSLDRANKSNIALKGQLTKERKRVGNGVCPCCNRTFKQLSAHMAQKHPEFKSEEP